MIKRIIESGLAGLIQQNARNVIGLKSLDVAEIEKLGKLMRNVGIGKVHEDFPTSHII